MKRWVYFLAAAVIASGAYLAGYASRGGDSSRVAGTETRRVLYWVDPMNPALKSDHPGIAPCGMPLEPVYADGIGADGAPAGPPGPVPAGTVRITPERQQLIGVRAEPASVRRVSHSLRLLGRVAADETRLHRLYSVTEGWIREVSGATTGSIVQEGEFLAAYYSQELLGPQQAYIYALDALDRFTKSGAATEEQLAINRNNVANTRQSLLNLGMSEKQTDTIAAQRKADRLVRIFSPETGFILARGVSKGLRFDRTAELYTIADLRRVWILADAFESDAEFIRPGSTALVSLPHQKRQYEARVSLVPPQFDPESRSLKVRLEVDNPGFAMRPDMFVDVDLPLDLPEALAVPADAVLDSGLRKTVFVDRGDGFFEPRKVEIGWRIGGQVEIKSGLMPGERIVVAGNFFVDSESRMKGASGPPPVALARDPVCGMDVDESAARAAGLTSGHAGRSWYFCSAGCKRAFDGSPGEHVASRDAEPSTGGGLLGGRAHD